MHFASRTNPTAVAEDDSMARLEQARAQILACYMRNKPDPEFDRVMAAYYDELEEQSDNAPSSPPTAKEEEDRVEEEPLDATSRNVQP